MVVKQSFNNILDKSKIIGKIKLLKPPKGGFFICNFTIDQILLFYDIISKILNLKGLLWRTMKF